MRHTLIVGAIFVALLTWASEAPAASQQLKGRYAVTGTNSCLSAPWGFDDDLQPRTGFFSTSSSVLATRTYNGDGTGWAEARQAYIVTSSSGSLNLWPSAGSMSMWLKFTYSIDADGLLTTEMVPGTFHGVVLEGPRAGHTFTYEGFSLKGMISADKKVIDLATVDPEISTITYYYPDGRLELKYEEICHRTRVQTYIGQ